MHIYYAIHFDQKKKIMLFICPTTCTVRMLGYFIRSWKHCVRKLSLLLVKLYSSLRICIRLSIEKEKMHANIFVDNNKLVV